MKKSRSWFKNQGVASLTIIIVSCMLLVTAAIKGDLVEVPHALRRGHGQTILTPT